MPRLDEKSKRDLLYGCINKYCRVSTYIVDEKVDRSFMCPVCGIVGIMVRGKIVRT